MSKQKSCEKCDKYEGVLSLIAALVIVVGFTYAGYREGRTSACNKAHHIVNVLWAEEQDYPKQAGEYAAMTALAISCN